MVMMVAIRRLSVVARRRLIEWCQDNDLVLPHVAGPFLVDANAGTITVHRYVVGDAAPAADFPELARDANGTLIVEVTSVPLQSLPPHNLVSDANFESQAPAA